MVGAGIGGLVAAARLAARGIPTVVVERAATPGGKMRELDVAGHQIDAGPTVLTMRWVFDELFSDLGRALSDYVVLDRAEILARHAWGADEQLDLHADINRSAEAIGVFSGAAESRRFLQFCGEARRIYRTLDGPFLRSSQPDPITLMRRIGMARLPALWGIRPFGRLWTALEGHFRDPRLRQLFGRYATYCGSSPYESPATLMLVAHVEQQGVWMVRGGMHRLALAIEAMARENGARFIYGAEVGEIAIASGRVRAVRLRSGEEIDATAVIVNADVGALAAGAFGSAVADSVAPGAANVRSLSAVTWALRADVSGFPLVRHNVFFSRDYRREFDSIFKRRAVPTDPTVYVCAQDRDAIEGKKAAGPERLFCLINAPADGDQHRYGPAEVERYASRAFAQLARCGLTIRRRPEAERVTSPTEFHDLFPATGGALYGAASHGWRASFRRAGARSAVDGLYLAGGSVHPGPGVPMVALSGKLAADSVLADMGAT
ncbi:MAG: 1-hydroxycarotenoid 3,4-desaturase CrtD [Burkholderiaceae bacterium]